MTVVQKEAEENMNWSYSKEFIWLKTLMTQPVLQTWIQIQKGSSCQNLFMAHLVTAVHKILHMLSRSKKIMFTQITFKTKQCYKKQG